VRGLAQLQKIILLLLLLPPPPPFRFFFQCQPRTVSILAIERTVVSVDVVAVVLVVDDADDYGIT